MRSDTIDDNQGEHNHSGTLQNLVVPCCTLFSDKPICIIYICNYMYICDMICVPVSSLEDNFDGA